MKHFKTFLAVVFLGIIAIQAVKSQAVIDQVVAVVGSKIIKYSDIENQYMQMKAQGEDADRCRILENLLNMKLLVNQAAIDSVEVTDSQVDNELSQRLNMYISQAGSVKALEEYFNKSLLEMKNDMRDEIRDNMLAQKMRQEIAGDITITPSEIKTFYNKLNKDSIPLVNSKIDLYQIGIYPPYSDQAILDLKDKLLDLRKRVINGESFTSLAVLYCEDGSAVKGGELGFYSKGELDPEYAKAAFALKERGDVSRIVESQFGYHIIQLIERRGDRVNTRHIIMKPKADPASITKAINRLDSIVDLVRKDSMTFEKAALYFSEDKNSRFNGGLIMNQQTEEPRFEMDQLTPQNYRAVKDLKVGEISAPYESADDKGKRIYVVSMIKRKTDPHKANLKDDFDLLKNYATNAKQNTIINEWVTEKIKSTYIHIDDSYKTCDLVRKGWVK